MLDLQVYKDRTKEATDLYNDIIEKQYRLDCCICSSIIDIVRDYHNRKDTRQWGKCTYEYRILDIDLEQEDTQVGYDGRMWNVVYVVLDDDNMIVIGISRNNPDATVEIDIDELDFKYQISVLEFVIKQVDKINIEKDNLKN